MGMYTMHHSAYPPLAIAFLNESETIRPPHSTHKNSAITRRKIYYNKNTKYYIQYT